MAKVEPILYLSRQDLDSLGLSISEITSILEEMFRLKAAGGTVLPPKIFFHRNGPRFYSSMVSSAPALGHAGCKWQSGDPENPKRGLAYIQGLFIMSEDATGQPVAIMDAKWITGNRTAAASALAAKHLARRARERWRCLDADLQGRKNLEALKTLLPGLARCRALTSSRIVRTRSSRRLAGGRCRGCRREERRGRRSGADVDRHGGADRGCPTAGHPAGVA